ncbi:MAG: trypsin-like peptidase domain-containing protein, partial [Acetobacteraceae bacterium]
MTIDQLEQLSEALADRLAAATFVVAIRTGRRAASGILWRDDVVVTSEQMLPEGAEFTVVRGGTEARAQLAGRDPGTNVAVLRLSQKLGTTLPVAAPSSRPGSLALIVGADHSGA